MLKPLHQQVQGFKAVLHYLNTSDRYRAAEI